MSKFVSNLKVKSKVFCTEKYCKYILDFGFTSCSSMLLISFVCSLHYISTLEYLINMQEVIIMEARNFSRINKCEKGWTFSKIIKK